ncbi:hypothetical protein IE53DRAFT_386085 [Violaceomyces palustris]|uniref:Uncharacterized protein n=1 Tax=Violaceomyces palustris TaxID=1673888 RepID=A0ACD0P0A4_9BASI|nr:hypothetical protein IE53DRAFT_386085 [Violaceomyces palustris]
MFASLTKSFARLSCSASSASALGSFTSSSRSSLPAATRSIHLSSSSCSKITSNPFQSSATTSIFSQATSSSSKISSRSPFQNLAGSTRNKSQLAPRRTKYRKAHKGRLPFPTGGSLKGTTIQEGVYGIRLLAPARLTAKQLNAAEVALKRKLKVIKGAQIFMRVFPDIPVCVKGNETRMGKGKGTFEYWACRASMGKVVFEIGGPVEIRPEIAREALRLASAKLPVPTEFVTASAAPRLGRLVETPLPPSASTGSSSASTVLKDGEKL